MAFYHHMTEPAHRLASGADAALADADGETALHKAASQVRELTATLPAYLGVVEGG